MQISKEKVEKALESVRKSLFGLSKFSDKFPSLDKTKNLQKRFAKILNSLNDEKTIKSDLISPIKNGSDIKNFELKTDNGQNVKAFLREVFDIEDEIDIKNDHFVKNDKTDFDKELEKSEVEYNGENVKKKEKVSEIDVNKIFGPPKEKTSVIKKRSFKDDFVEKKRSEISEDLNDMAVTLKDTAVNFGQTILGDLTVLIS
ncbi:hypothetical protein MHBO_001176 [Bonamia ostreae]|uniref:Uncharacterized protein n=1 Tax=Bonamia ostreae TaxID=126728 RepID=A0ABV2AI09_9EUKA